MYSTENLDAQFKLDVDNRFDISEFPYVTVSFSASMNNVPVELTKDNLVILERIKAGADYNLPSVPNEVTPLSSGEQTFTWLVKQDDIENISVSQLIATYDDQIVTKTLAFDISNVPRMIVTEAESGISISEINFGKVNPGDNKIFQLYANMIKAIKDGNNELPVQVDSITIDSDYFTFNWQGSIINRNPPPTLMYSGFYFLVDIFFNPPDDQYYTGVVTFHYHSGMTKSITLLGNEYKIEREKSLNLVRPLGGEAVLPCQNLEITWKGHSKNLPTYIDVSYDGGASWEEIVSVIDSTYIWTVPEIITDELLIRVSQKFAKTKEVLLKEDNNPVFSIDFSSDGSRLIAASRNGKLREWDLIDFTVSRNFNAELSSNQHQMYSIGLDYYNNDSNISLAYNNISASSLVFDTLAIFDIDNEIPIAKAGINPNFNSRNMKVDPQNRYSVTLPNFGNELHFFSLNDGSYLRSLRFNAPITSFVLSKDDFGVATLYDGSIQIFSLSELTITKEINIQNIPLVIETAVAPNGKLIGLACKSTNSGEATNVLVIDIDDEIIVRSMQKTFSDPVGIDFNSTSSLLLLASKATPQITFLDLPSNQNVGNMGANLGQITDFAFSPEGNAIATSSDSQENLLYRTITYPEDDTTTFMFIQKPDISIQSAVFEDTYLGIKNPKTFSTIFCNQGKVALSLKDYHFKYDEHFSLVTDFDKDSLQPNDCLEINFAFTPLDTGMLNDTLIFQYCTGEVLLPMEGRGLGRTITFLNPIIDFGEVCISDSSFREFDLFRNDDPVPLILNGLSLETSNNSHFAIETKYSDTIIAPGGVVRVRVLFSPLETGILEDDVIVYHSNQLKFIPNMHITGTGIGSFLQFSHNNLLFIPEILDRKIEIFNDGDAEVFIDNLIPDIQGIFEIITSLPIRIAPKSSEFIEIRWNGEPTDIVEMQIEASPCIARQTFKLGEYHSESLVSIPIVTVDPVEEAVIPINFQNKEKIKYNGERFFEAEFTINPKLFLPVEISTDYNSAQILKNEVVADKRYIKVSVKGEFTDSGTLAYLKGIPGLSETNESIIEFTDDIQHWGSAIDNSVENGKIIVKGECENRLVIRNSNPVNIQSISPNPADKLLEIEFDITKEGYYKIEIYDNSGVKIFSTEDIYLFTGPNRITLNVSFIPSGSYRIVIRSANGIASEKIQIIR